MTTTTLRHVPGSQLARQSQAVATAGQWWLGVRPDKSMPKEGRVSWHEKEEMSEEVMPMPYISFRVSR